MWHRAFITPLLAVLLGLFPALSWTDDGVTGPEESTVEDRPASESVSEQEEGELPGFLGRMPKNLLIVPIPTSSPTFGTGLILGGAWFYSQTEEQKAAQPASYTGAAAAYTSNDSWAVGVLQQNYWKQDTWRFTGVAGYVNLRLDLVGPGTGGESESRIDWLVKGAVAQGRLSRRIGGNWFLGGTARYLDIDQTLSLGGQDEPEQQEDSFRFGSKISAAALGLNLDYDSRDMPTNAFQGRFLELKALNSKLGGDSDGSYQSYHARFRSYHLLSDSLVLAWEVNGCARGGQAPLWDTCRLGLRGFSATEYLGKKSLFGQAEIRWRMYKRWGLVGFAGAGRIYDSLGGYGENETVPSYGVGIRFMVLESQRINLRVDYARSDKGNDSWYLAVTEAF